MFVVVKNKPLTVCPISSNMNKIGKEFPYNVELKDWKADGLYKPSHVKVDCSGVITFNDIKKLHGFLTSSDESNVIIAYNGAPQKTILEGLVD